MHFSENVSLKPYNTFRIDVSAKYFSTFSTLDELREICDFKKASPFIVIGGGSNILFTQNFDGHVAKNDLPGIEVINEDAEYIYVKCGAGVLWHSFVLYCIENNYGGVENLSLIPGSTGASPMQNIGAYGVEIKDVFHELEAFHINHKKIEIFSAKDCEFGYRESVFKNKLKGQFIITSVTFKLNKSPVFNISYGAIQQELDNMNAEQLSIKAISDAVIRIRQSKLPDPAETGNAGSFFKNPAISVERYNTFKDDFPLVISYPVKNGIKLAAGWLIEQCGWKGYRKGDAGCHVRQALVLVNYNNATGKEIYNLSTEIIQSVFEKFGIELEREVNIL